MSVEPLHNLDQDVRDEIAQFRCELDRLRSEICAWNDSTAAVTDELDGSAVTPSLNFQLSARHDYLVTKLKSLSYVATPSSIHSLPDDVLYWVLRLLHMSSTISPEDLLEWYDNLPSMLCTVCLRWQALVLSSPSLWRRIRLNALVDQESIERLHLYLELSRDQSLTIITESKTLGKLRKPALDILSAHAHRIHIASDVSDTYWFWEFGPETDTFTLIAHPQHGQTMGLPLAVTVGELDVNMPATFIDYLWHFQNLQCLRLTVARDSDISIAALHGRELPMLHKLSITDEASDDPVSLLRNFPPHKLHQLQLTIRKTLSKEKYEGLESYLLCNMPKLAYLDLKITKTKGTPWKSSPPETPSISIKDLSFCMLGTQRTNLPTRLVYNTPALESCSLSWPTFETPPPFNSRLRFLELTFQGLTTVKQRLPKVNKVVLEHLEHLRVFFGDSDDHMLSILNAIYVPSLLRLEIIEKNLARPDCDDIVFPKASDIEILSSSPHLQHLSLYFHHAYDIPSLPTLKTLTGCLINWTDLLSLDLPELSALSLWYLKPQTKITGLTQESGELDCENSPSRDDDGNVTYLESLLEPKFNHITDLSFDNPRRGCQPHDAVLDRFCDFLTILPSLQKVAFPPVTFELIPYIDLLTERMAKDPTFCPQLEEISNRDYPSCWDRFIQMIYLRNISALLSVDSRHLRRIHVLRFWRLPHSSIVGQLTTAMSGKYPSSCFQTPACAEVCWPHRPLLKYARPRKGTTPCFMCHNARLETGCLYQRSRDHYCDRWIGSALVETLLAP